MAPLCSPSPHRRTGAHPFRPAPMSYWIARGGLSASRISTQRVILCAARAIGLVAGLTQRATPGNLWLAGLRAALGRARWRWGCGYLPQARQTPGRGTRTEGVGPDPGGAQGLSARIASAAWGAAPPPCVESWADSEQPRARGACHAQAAAAARLSRSSALLLARVRARQCPLLDTGLGGRERWIQVKRAGCVSWHLQMPWLGQGLLLPRGLLRGRRTPHSRGRRAKGAVSRVERRTRKTADVP